MVKKSFVQVLLDRGIFVFNEIEKYSLAAQNQHMSLDEYLKANGLISNIVLSQVYADQFSLPFIDSITEKMSDPELLSKIPLKFLRENGVIPIVYEAEITIVTSNPNDFQPIDELMLILGENSKIGVSLHGTIIDAINRYYPLEGTKQMIEELSEEQDINGAMELGTIKEEDILGMATEAPIIKLVNHILYQAVKREASDIHIEPFEKELHVRFRIDGILHPIFTPPKRAQAALTSRIKIMSNLNIAEKRIPQDGRIPIKIADKAIDIRVSILPVSFGECIVMRLLDKTKTFGALDTLGLSKRDLEILNYSISQPNGIILITGPTGSGKTSTLYSILNTLKSPEVNIVTVEDPVEFQVSGVNQVQVKESIGLTFAAALRSILRQDPDIIMIGETRDQETAQIAIQSSLTGHLVLSTLHTNSAPAAITRLIDMGIEPFLISSSLTTVVAQRLVRKLCANCKRVYKPSPEILKRLPISQEEVNKITFYEPVGCEECSSTGYKGRIAIFEMMMMSSAISKLTIERSDTLEIARQAQKEGMTTLVQDGVAKIKSGLTTIDEVLSVASERGVEF